MKVTVIIEVEGRKVASHSVEHKKYTKVPGLFDEKERDIIIVGDPVSNFAEYEKTAKYKLDNIAFRAMNRTMADIIKEFFT